MSCIVGYTQDGHIWMGADSAGTTEGGNQFSLSTPKIYKESEFLIGSVGQCRGLQLVQDFLDLEDLIKKAGDAYSDWSLIQSLAESARECFADRGYANVKEGRESGDIFLIGFRGQLYQIEAEFDVLQFNGNCHAVGSGDMIALGALYALSTVWGPDGSYQPKDFVEFALEAASKYRSDVRPPFIIEHI